MTVCSLLGSGFLIARRTCGFPLLYSFLLAPLAALVPITIVGSGFYVIYKISPLVVMLMLWVPFLIAAFTAQKTAPPLPRHTNVRPTMFAFLLFSIYTVLIGVWFFILFSSRTTLSLLGPWDTISPLIIPLYFLTTLVLALLLLTSRSYLNVIALSIHCFASISVAFIRFPLIFGFDPIIHVAAEKLVFEQGFANPKTFYYIGQYALVPFLAHVFHVPVGAIHQSLLPFLTALSLPPLLFSSVLPIVALVFLALPFPHLIMTTPWSLAYCSIILGLLSSILGLQNNNRRLFWAAGALVLFALVLHPLAGIPGMFFLAIMLTLQSHVRSKKILAGGMTIMGALGVPLALVVNSLISTQGTVRIHFPDISLLSQLFAIQPLQTRFLPILDAASLISYQGILIFSLLVLAGIICTRKSWNNFYTACLVSALMTLVSGVLMYSSLSFETLASFEQSDYAQRMIQIATLFLLPFPAAAITVFIKKLTRQHRPVIVPVVLLVIAGTLTASLYLSYPRNDAHTPSHAYTLSSTDILAVRAIEEDAQDKPYAVLSNQVLASAAIREFGFARYFTVPPYGEIFYYPVPSGSPLAKKYYDMLRTPSRDVAEQAMDLVHVSRIYFVVRNYEFRFPIIVRDGKRSANEWFPIDDDKAYVFLYER